MRQKTICLIFLILLKSDLKTSLRTFKTNMRLIEYVTFYEKHYNYMKGHIENRYNEESPTQ